MVSWNEYKINVNLKLLNYWPKITENFAVIIYNNLYLTTTYFDKINAQCHFHCIPSKHNYL